MLAHELSHVAHRDVTVMTIASTAGHRRRDAHPGCAVRRAVRRRPPRNNNNNGGVPVWLVVLVVSLVVYAVSFFLTRLLSRYRELCADRSGAYLTMKPPALATALQKISGGMAAIPDRDLRAPQLDERLLHRPGDQGVSLEPAHLDPPLAGAAARAAGEDRRPSSAGRWTAASGPGAVTLGFWGAITGRTQAEAGQPRRAVPAALGRDHAADRGRASLPTGTRVGVLPRGRGRGVPADAGRRRGAARRRRRQAGRRSVRATTSASPGWSSTGPATTSRGSVTDLHAVNTALEEQGFGDRAALLAWCRSPTRRARRLGLVYLYKQGTFYAVRPDRSEDRATTCWRSRSATCSRPSCRWSRTSSAGSPSGAPPASDAESAQRGGSRRVGAKRPKSRRVGL